MLTFRLIPTYRNISGEIRHVVKNNISRQKILSEPKYQYVTSVSPSEAYSSRSAAKNINASESGDDLRRLRNFHDRPRSKPKQNAPKDVKIIKVKKYTSFKRDEADVFGNLSSHKPFWYPDINEEAKVDNDQDDDSTMVKNISRQFRCSHNYLERMKQLVAEKKLKEALDLFIDMKRNYVTPLQAHFTYMIGACGRFGFTEMAFKLLKQMTDRNFHPTPATLTGLFNACGECPFPEFGLKKARLLKEKIKSKNWEVNQITYHSMIKAFGKCGDIQTAFQIVDEMVEAGIKIDVSTYSFLLMSCIADKEAGFTHAVEVLRKMKNRKCLPNVFSFNLLLRATRDCDVGPEEVSCLLLQHWSSYLSRPYGFKTKGTLPQKEVLQLLGGKIEESINSPNSPDNLKVIGVEEAKFESDDNTSSSLQERKRNESVSNNEKISQLSVLGVRPVQGTNILDLGKIKTPSDRLSLIGGAVGILENMKQIRVKPNIKTFTLLLECLPPNSEAEQQLMCLLDEYKINPDIGFFNILIKRRQFRYDNAGAHEVLVLISKWSLSPDLITFGVLALGCRNHRHFEVFMGDMEKLGCAPNIEICGSLLSSACSYVDFVYLRKVLELMDDLEIAPDEVMLRKIENTLENTRKNIIDMEHGKSVRDVYRKEGFTERYKEFCILYEQWLKKTKCDKEEHLWDQFRTNIVEKQNVKPFTPLVLD